MITIAAPLPLPLAVLLLPFGQDLAGEGRPLPTLHQLDCRNWLRLREAGGLFLLGFGELPYQRSPAWL